MARLRTLLSTILLLAGACFAQQDILLPSTSSPYQVVVTGAPWSTVAANYIFTPTSPDSTVCVFVTNNNTTATHSISMNLVQTGDQTVTTYSNQTLKWITVPIGGTVFPVNILNLSTISFFFRSSSAARLALLVSGTSGGTGGPDTVNINIVQPSTSSFCGSAGQAGPSVIAIGPTPIGSAIPSLFQSPVQVGGEGVTGANYTGLAEVLAIDPTTKGVSVGSIADVVEGTTPMRGASINSANGGSTVFEVLHVYPWGKGSDADLSTGAGDQSSPFRNSRRYGLATSSTFAWASDAIGNNTPLRTFGANSTTSNPAAGAMLFSVTVNNGGNGLNPHNVVMSCSAACDMIINKVSSNGTTCGALTPYKTGDPNLAGPATTSTAQQAGCAANPTVVQQLFHFYIGAGTTQVYNMEGYYYVSGATAAQGFDVVEGGALTGNASVTVDWMER